MSNVLYIYHIGIPLTFLAHCVSYETSFMFISCWIEVVLVTHHVLCFMFYMTRTLVHMKYSPHSFLSNLCPVHEVVLCFMFYMYQVGISKPLSCFMFILPLRHIGPSRFFVSKTLDYIKHKTYLGKLQGLKITKF